MCFAVLSSKICSLRYLYLNLNLNFTFDLPPTGCASRVVHVGSVTVVSPTTLSCPFQYDSTSAPYLVLCHPVDGQWDHQRSHFRRSIGLHHGENETAPVRLPKRGMEFVCCVDSRGFRLSWLYASLASRLALTNDYFKFCARFWILKRCKKTSFILWISLSFMLMYCKLMYISA
jgi:hypothetical protein